MQLRGDGYKPMIEVPGHAHSDAILLAKTVAVQEQVENVEKVETKAGITINTKGMGQAPFWVAVIGGLTVFQMIKKKVEGRSVLDNKDVKYIASNEKEEKELHIFACEGCGYEMMPARGREGKFFPDDFKCPICSAPKEKFWDMNDPTDPRNQEKEEEAAAPAAAAKSDTPPPPPKVTAADLEGAKKMIEGIVDKTNSNPLMIRLAWHDAGTFDKSVAAPWPKAGGAVASIRFQPELNHGANAGVITAIKLLEPVKDAFPAVSYADLFQMASAVGVELAGGPKIDMIYGRVDVSGPEDCSPEGNLPDAEAGEGGKYGGKPEMEDTTAAGHLRKVFYRMGLTDEEIVALSGAHTLGRAYKDRSGLGAEKTKFTDGSKAVRADGKEGIGRKGGSSWTEQWLKFDNSYFKTVPDANADPELLKLSTDKTLFEDEGFKPFAEKFRDSEEEFFKSYAAAHKKLSELGSKFEPEGGIKI